MLIRLGVQLKLVFENILLDFSLKQFTQLVKCIIGFRTRSHFVAEPTEKLVNIDMYKRPLTNQTGAIIFDNGRPNNGYYLQRNQCKA